MTFNIVLLIIAAYGAGFIDSIAGGGGLISLPALLAVGVPAHVALGTNKFQAMFGTFFAALNYARKSKIIWKAALIGIPFALLGSYVGAELTLFVSVKMLTKILIILLPPAAILMFFSNSLLKERGSGQTKHKISLLPVAVVCFAISLYDGFFGPGTGTFLIVFMVLFCKIPLINSSATAKIFNLGSNVGAFITFMISGNVLYTIGIIMAIANIAGNITGSNLAIKKGNPMVLRFVFIAITLLFIYLVWNYFR